MATCKLICHATIRRGMLPLLYLAHIIGWQWLSRICLKMKVEAVPVQ